jgi:acyl carrier protein
MQELTAEVVEQRLKDEIAAILSRDPASIDTEAPLHALGMDSLSFLEVLVFIEKNFNL